jgi:site-specific recombinase XerD
MSIDRDLFRNLSDLVKTLPDVGALQQASERLNSTAAQAMRRQHEALASLASPISTLGESLSRIRSQIPTFELPHGMQTTLEQIQHTFKSLDYGSSSWQAGFGTALKALEDSGFTSEIRPLGEMVTGGASGQDIRSIGEMLAGSAFGQQIRSMQEVLGSLPALPKFDIPTTWNTGLVEAVARVHAKAETLAAASSASDDDWGVLLGDAQALRETAPADDRQGVDAWLKLIFSFLAGAFIEDPLKDLVRKKALAALFVVLAAIQPLSVPAKPDIPALFQGQPAPHGWLEGGQWQGEGLPAVIQRAGPLAVRRTVEFFTAEIRNRNTRQAYARAVGEFFAWCGDRNLELADITPFHVAAYVEDLGRERSAPTVKQHLAAIRMLFDYLVVGQVLPMNPAASVRGPKHVVKRGKTPVLSSDQARALLDSIDIGPLIGLRDRALLGVMVYSFARVGAASAMRVEDYYANGKRWWFRLNEKGGKRHEVPAHHKAEAYLDAYLDAAAIRGDRRGPLFRTFGRDGELTGNPMHRTDVLRMIKRRARAAGLPETTCCHTFRATGITAYLENGGTLEKAQQIAAHESPRTTKLYDRTSDELTLDEIERILI